jgi:chromosome segregation ATPase
VQQLSAENEDLAAVVETLKTELTNSNSDNERLQTELDGLRARTARDDADDAEALRETQAELEAARIEREEWARLAEQERMLREEARDTADALRRDVEMERDTKRRLEADLSSEREKATNLQSVLEDFQAGMVHSRPFALTLTY